MIYWKLAKQSNLSSKIPTMIGNETVKEAKSDLFYNLAGVYLILVGVIGGTLNIFALLKAITVRKIVNCILSLFKLLNISIDYFYL